MQAERACHLRHHSRIFLTPSCSFIRIPNAKAPAEIQIPQRNSCRCKLLHIAADSLESAAEGIERHDLRADVRADSLPMNEPRALVLQVQALRFGPLQPEFMMVSARRNVRMAAGLNVGIRAN